MRRGVLCLLAAISAAACNAGQPASVAAPLELTISSIESNTASPDLGPGQLANMLSLEGLTHVGSDGRAAPRLAESWRWENDGRRLRINLRSGVKFHDGTPLTPELAAELLQQAISRPANRAQYPSIVDIAAVRTDQSQLVLELSQPSAFLLEDLTVLLRKGEDNTGTGPYRVVERNAEQVVFERFGDYYLGQPAIAKVRVRLGETLRTAWTSLLRADVDMVMEVPADAIQFIRNESISAFSFSRSYQYLIAFNSRRAPFTSPVVRRALNYAVNRDAIISDVFGNNGVPSTGPLWIKHWAYDTQQPAFTFDPQMASALLDQTGAHVRQSDAASSPSRFRFTCLIPEGYSVYERLALEVQKQLYDVGVDVQFDVIPLREYDTRLRAGDFDAALVDLISGPMFARSYVFWRSARESRDLNVFGYENPEVDRLFGVLKTSINDAAIRSATRRLQQLFLEDPPALFLVWNERTRAVRRNFHVVQEPDRDPLLTLWRWTADNPGATALTQ